jgi:hypothetical protein
MQTNIVGLGKAEDALGDKNDKITAKNLKAGKTIAETSDEVGGAGEAFQELGLRYEDLAKLSPEKQFDVLAQKLADVTDPMYRTTLAMKIFGKAGAQLLPMLANGAAGLNAMKAEADKLGVVFTPEEVAMAAMFDDQLNRVKEAFFGVVKSAVGLKTINGIMQKLIDYLVALRDNKAFQTFVEGVKNALIEIAAKFVWLGARLYEFFKTNEGWFREWGLMMIGIVILFKTGLAIPLIKMAGMLGWAIIRALVKPWALVAMAALAAGAAIGLALGAAYDSITEGTDFIDNFAKRWDKLKQGVGEAVGAIGDALIPDDLAKFMSDFKDVGKGGKLDWNLSLPPELPKSLGMEMEEGAARGAERGISKAPEWSRVFGGGIGSEWSKAFSSDRQQAERQLQAIKDTNKILESLKASGAIVFGGT